MEVHESVIDGVEVTEQIVDGNGSKSIEHLSGASYATSPKVHMVNYHNHFVPLLDNEEKKDTHIANQLLDEPAMMPAVQVSTVETLPSVVMPSPSVIEKLFSTLHQIHWDNIKEVKFQGEGSYGNVYKAQWENIQVAVKKLHLKKLSKNLEANFVKEANIMHTYRHRHIVQLYGICQEVEHYALVMEYMEKGSLLDHQFW